MINIQKADKLYTNMTRVNILRADLHLEIEPNKPLTSNHVLIHLHCTSKTIKYFRIDTLDHPNFKSIVLAIQIYPLDST